jgi:hypothetical protein
VSERTPAPGESAERLFLSFAQPSNHTSPIPSKAGWKQTGDISENKKAVRQRSTLFERSYCLGSCLRSSIKRDFNTDGCDRE